MDNIIKWMCENKVWLFSGIGLLPIAWIGKIIFRNWQASKSQKIKSGNYSINIQAGENANVKDVPKSDNDKYEE